MTRNIPGVIDYAVLAQQHRPKTAQAMCAEVRRLAANGLTPLDISVALRLDLAAVREMLIATPGEAVQACAEAWKR